MSEDGLITFPCQDHMVSRLTALITSQLENAIFSKGRALFAVSGGSSPKPLYENLSRQNIDWSNVDIILVDERWVDFDEEGSNESFIQKTLLQNQAQAANLIGLKNEAMTPLKGLNILKEKTNSLSNLIDVAILGMGPDGHTASWFPQAQNLNEALALDNDAKFAAIKANQSTVTGKHLDRMTMTLSFIAKAKFPILMISGEKKRDAYAFAIKDETSLFDAPVKALHQHCSTLWACWAP